MYLTYKEKSKEGAFYTPQWAAQKAAQRLLHVFPSEFGWKFYDPAAGEGSLLGALMSTAPKADAEGTTLREEDVLICQNKGIKCSKFDFLNGNFDNLPQSITTAAQQGRLVMFMNPPFEANKVCAFMERAWKLGAIGMGLFSKMDIYKGQSLQGFREKHKLRMNIVSTPFITISTAFGCKGKWPVIFSVML